ncbi:Aldo/keto reductase [Saitoella complicata NRRL Y-17804]|nr:Aldo/keto reductase [Saitoella complicata NRRL Y-17804]ODQ50206.1 Aldo/keto reductase [Saitoella complicata NRRL Y-17804]
MPTPLRNNHAIPSLGFGVYDSPPHTTRASVSHALAAGYRHIDTAQYYENEAQVGLAIRESRIPRDEIFVTTKALDGSGSVDDILCRMRKSVADIDGEEGYVDLFLVHSPSVGKEERKRIWLALERLHDLNLTRAIGVSNYGVKHLEELQTYASPHHFPPAANQIELHPWCQQRPITTYCSSLKIPLLAYCPLVRAQRSTDPILTRIATAHNVSWAQVLVRWALQKGFVPLPKSDTKERIAGNAAVWGWALTEEEMGELDGLDEGAEGAIGPNPVECE